VVVQVLPLHGERRQLPAGSARHAGAVGIRSLMARRAGERGNAAASRSAYDVEQVGMAIIALLGVARGSMAIDAARMREHRVHLLPGGETFGARRCAGCQSPFEPDDGGEGRGDREAVSTIHRPTVTPGPRAAIVKTCSIDRRSAATQIHGWCHATSSLKRAREVWLIVEAAFHGDLRKRHLPGLHQADGSLEAKP